MKPQLNLQQAREFMRWLGAPRVLVAITEGQPIRAATPRTGTAFERFLSANADKNLYFSVNRTRGPMTKKPTKADLKWFEFAHVELDPSNDVTDLDTWQAMTRAKLKAAQWPPSIIWRSGNGIQALWRMSSPILLDSPEAIARCESKNSGLLRAFVDDQTKLEGTWNVDRILRLPGTTNYPNKVKRAAGRKIGKAGHVEIL